MPKVRKGPTHKCRDGVSCHHTIKDLNPRSQVVKSSEMTVIRALAIIKLWDEEIHRDRDFGWNDWTDIKPSKYFKILGERAYSVDAILIEMFKRYKDGTLHRQTLDLYETLPDGIWKQSRKDTPKRKLELKGRRDGIDAIREKLGR